MRRIANIGYAVALGLVVFVVWDSVVRQRYGRVLYTFDSDHGLHTGDIPILLVGGAVCVALLFRLYRGLT